MSENDKTTCKTPSAESDEVTPEQFAAAVERLVAQGRVITMTDENGETLYKAATQH